MCKRGNKTNEGTKSNNGNRGNMGNNNNRGNISNENPPQKHLRRKKGVPKKLQVPGTQ